MSTISQSLSKRQKKKNTEFLVTFQFAEFFSSNISELNDFTNFSRQIFSESKQMNSSVLTNFSRQILSKIKTKTLNSVF